MNCFNKIMKRLLESCLSADSLPLITGLFILQIVTTQWHLWNCFVTGSLTPAELLSYCWGTLVWRTRRWRWHCSEENTWRLQNYLSRSCQCWWTLMLGSRWQSPHQYSGMLVSWRLGWGGMEARHWRRKPRLMSSWITGSHHYIPTLLNYSRINWCTR